MFTSCASGLKPLVGFGTASSSVEFLLNYQAKLQSLLCVIIRGSQTNNFHSSGHWTMTLGLREQQ